MSLADFDNGYWYALDLKAFAKRLGIPSAGTLRKDELEVAIKHFLSTGELRGPTKRRLALAGSGKAKRTRDVERGLHLDLPVAVYTNDTETKDFLERESLALDPDYRRKSGARYRLNRWRDEKLMAGKAITYRDLVAEYVRLSRTKGAFEQIPHGRYINFLSDFMAAEQGASKEQALAAWKKLKRLDIPKTYKAWATRKRR